MLVPTVEPEVTIVCVPRERFDYTTDSLQSLYDKTTLPFELIYVDNALPNSVRRDLRREARARGFEIVRAQRPLTPNEARNLGLFHAKGRYVLFVDNDVVFDDNWLEALLACMKDKKAAVAAPLVCQHAPHHTIVHCAGGEFMGREQFDRFRQQPMPGSGTAEERRWLIEEKIYLQDHPVEEAGQEPLQVGFVEFHCFIAEAEFLRAHGGFDRNMMSTKEYVDLAMTVARAGGAIWIEPKSRVTFLTHPPQPVLKLSELPYFMLRWSDDWEYRSLRHFAAKWGLVENEYFTKRYDKLGWRRRAEFINPIAAYFEPLGKPVRRWVKRRLVAAEKRYNKYLTRRHASRYLKTENA